MRRAACVGLAAALLAFPGAQADGAATDSAAIEPALAQAACLGPGERFAVRGDVTQVACAPHARIADLPAQFVAECARLRGQWRCARPLLAVRVSVGARTVLVTPRGPTFEFAHEVVRLLVEHPTHFNGRDLAQMLQGLCVVESLGAGAFAGARDYRVRCGDRGVVVTRACVDAACRMFPARWDDLAGSDPAP